MSNWTEEYLWKEEELKQDTSFMKKMKNKILNRYISNNMTASYEKDIE